MTNREKAQLILRKYPESRFNRASFMWRFLEEFCGVRVVASRTQFEEFWKVEPALERTLRDLLKEDEFKPEAKQDSKRYEKETLFKEWHNNLPDKEDFHKAFDTDKEYFQ